MTLSILLTFFSSLIALTDTSIHTTVEAQAIVSDAGVTPFWMRSLQYGSVPMENPGLVLRAWNGKGYNLKKKYDWKYEVEATGWTGKQNDFWLTQAYVSGRWRKWELWAGRRKEVYGLGDTTMTGGFYAWSGNALPMPKVQLGTRDYLNFAKGWLGVHMTYSHGWFDNQGLIENVFLHQKSLYGRLGKPNSKIQIFGGLNHQVQWGGKRKIAEGFGFDNFPSSLNAYFYVITLLKDRTIVKIDTNTSRDDANNQYGNHLGSIDFALKLNLSWGELLFYKQTAYETGRVFSLVTSDDGISGISINNKRHGFFKRFNIEYIYTANQGSYIAPLAKLVGITKDPHQIETESYFNNGARGTGYQYFNKEIGTPMLMMDRNTFLKGGNTFSYNSIKGINLSSEFFILEKFKLELKYTKSLNAFSRSESYLSQQSYLIKISKTHSKKLEYKAVIAYDNGMMLPKSFALSVGTRFLLF